MSPETLALLSRPELRASLVAGALAAAVAVSEHHLASRVHHKAWFDPGIGIALAFYVALGLAGGQPLEVRGPCAVGTMSACVVTAPLLLGATRVIDRRALLGCMLLAVAGLFFCVPDTEEALLLAGVAAPFALAIPFAPPVRPVGAAAFAVAFAWVAATGGRARPGSSIAALACLGVLVVAPIVARRGTNLGVRELLGVQLLTVFVAARVIPHDPPFVTLLCQCAWLLVLAVGLSRFTVASDQGPA